MEICDIHMFIYVEFKVIHMFLKGRRLKYKPAYAKSKQMDLHMKDNSLIKRINMYISVSKNNVYKCLFFKSNYCLIHLFHSRCIVCFVILIVWMLHLKKVFMYTPRFQFGHFIWFKVLETHQSPCGWTCSSVNMWTDRVQRKSCWPAADWVCLSHTKTHTHTHTQVHELWPRWSGLVFIAE